MSTSLIASFAGPLADSDRQTLENSVAAVVGDAASLSWHVSPTPQQGVVDSTRTAGGDGSPSAVSARCPSCQLEFALGAADL